MSRKVRTLNITQEILAWSTTLFLSLSITMLGITTAHAQAPGEEIFVSSFIDGTIVRIDLNTFTQTVILSGLTNPEDGACNSEGLIYFAESGSGRIRLFNRDGSGVTTVLASSTLQPEGLSFDASDNLFFNTRLAANGAAWRIAGGVPGASPVQATSVFTSFGEGTVFTAGGELLAVDAVGAGGGGPGRVFKFTPPFSFSNTGTVFATVTSSFFAGGIAINSVGDVFVAENGPGTGGGTGTIRRFSSSGVPLGVFASGLRNPAFLEFDSADNLYVTEFVAQINPSDVDRVLRITPDGTQTVIANLRGALGLAICKVLQVQIDIKPGSFPNSINPKSKGVIPVAILTTDSFDATTVDPTTVLFGRTGTEATPVQSALEDVDGDGDTDMILHFNTQATGIQCGDTSASLTGETLSGQRIQGSDSVKTAGCK